MQVDLSQLPPPDVIVQRSFDSLRDAMLDEFLARMRGYDPDYPAPQPSDPVYVQIEVAAYHELVRRQEFNDNARQLLLAYARGSALDHIGVTYYSTQRLVIDPGDPDASPPVPPTMEADAAYVERLLLAQEAFSTAGSRGAYIYWARSAAGGVKDVAVLSPAAGEIEIPLLGHAGDGTPDNELLKIVEAAVRGADVRPLTDYVNVVAAQVAHYTVKAKLHVADDADAGIVLDAAHDRVADFVERSHRLGRTIYRDAVVAQLYVAGVRFVELQSPAGDIECDAYQAAWCELIDLESGTYE